MGSIENLPSFEFLTLEVAKPIPTDFTGKRED